MSTWSELDLEVQKLIDDRNETFWSLSTIRWLLEHAEFLVALYRGIGETTKDLNLTAGTQLYDMHTVQGGSFADFIVPVRIRIAGVPLYVTDLPSLSRYDRNWRLATGTPDRYFMIGGNILGFVGSADVVASITYLRVPPTGVAGTEFPVISTNWQDVLPMYAAAFLNAAEGKPAEAQPLIEKFAELIGMKKDPRFFPQEKEKGETGATDTVYRYPQE